MPHFRKCLGHFFQNTLIMTQNMNPHAEPMNPHAEPLLQFNRTLIVPSPIFTFLHTQSLLSSELSQDSSSSDALHRTAFVQSVQEHDSMQGRPARRHGHFPGTLQFVSLQKRCVISLTWIGAQSFSYIFSSSISSLPLVHPWPTGSFSCGFAM